MAAALGCGGSQPEGQRAGGEQATAVQPLRFDAGPPWRDPYGQSPLWRRAALGDPIDLARLAQQHTPNSLVGIVATGGPVATVALSTIPYLQGNFAAGLELCRLLPRVSGPSAQLLLATMAASLQDGPDQESFDPAQNLRCLERLQPWTVRGDGQPPANAPQDEAKLGASDATVQTTASARDLASIVASYLRQ